MNESEEIPDLSVVIKKVVSGGQCGVDRGATKAAIGRGLPYGGWVPKGGRTEDDADILNDFPHYQECESRNYPVRTVMNVRDSDITVVITPYSIYKSPGTTLTIETCKKQGKPHFVSCTTISRDVQEIAEFIVKQRIELGRSLVVNFAGPRDMSRADVYIDSVFNRICKLLAKNPDFFS